MAVEHLVTAGNKDPQGPKNHANNVWLVGDDQEVLVIDPAHDAQAVAEAVGGRKVVAVLVTHGHWDHSRSAPEFSQLVDAPVYLNEADAFLWEESCGDASFEHLADGATFTAGGVSLEARHTPGHTPGSTCLWAPAEHCVFSGDTLFENGVGATRWAYSSEPQIYESIRERLMILPDDVAVHTGHGPSTSIGRERPGIG